MRNIRLDLEYDGRNYCGWQWQPIVKTIEGEIKNAIEKMVQHEITPYSCGRTDSGVHAEQHVMNFFTDKTIPAYQLLRGLNSILPDDITVYRVIDVPQEWSARHDALEREYRYTIYNDPVSSALWRERSYWVRYPLNINAMRHAAQYLRGKHDFSAFRSIHCDAEKPIRTLSDVRIVEELPLLQIYVKGLSFLRHQVRIICGTLLEIGMEKQPPEWVQALLVGKDRDQAGVTLPAGGLTLIAVRYEMDQELFQGMRSYANGPVQVYGSKSMGKTFV